MELTRGQVTLDLMLCVTQDLVWDVNVTAATPFNICVVGRGTPRKSDMIILSFQRAELSQMRRLKKLKWKIKKVTAKERTKAVQIEAQVEYTKEGGLFKFRRLLAWLLACLVVLFKQV